MDSQTAALNSSGDSMMHCTVGGIVAVVETGDQYIWTRVFYFVHWAGCQTVTGLAFVTFFPSHLRTQGNPWSEVSVYSA